MSVQLHNVFLLGKRELSLYASIDYQTGKSEVQRT